MSRTYHEHHQAGRMARTMHGSFNNSKKQFPVVSDLYKVRELSRVEKVQMLPKWDFVSVELRYNFVSLDHSL